MSVRFVIEPLDFVRSAGTHHDKIPLVELERLQDYLFNNNGELIYTISGEFKENGRPSLHIKIKGEINLCCQRCLGKLTQNLDLQKTLVLVSNKSEFDQFDDDDSMDAILATPDIDVLNLIEDEIILSLSISSRHQEDECKMRELIESNTASKKKSEHPFAVLAELKKTR